MRASSASLPASTTSYPARSPSHCHPAAAAAARAAPRRATRARACPGATNEPHLAVQHRSGPRQGREHPALDGQPLRDFTLHLAPVEALVSVVGKRPARPVPFINDSRHGEAGGGTQHLQRRIALAVRVVAQPAQTRGRAEELLPEEAGARFDGHADDDESAVGGQPAQIVEDPPALRLEAMLEHLHAGHDGPRPALGWAEIARHGEAYARKIAEPLAAAGNLIGFDVDAARSRESVVDHRAERPLAASV